jgi:two-component system cell cycle sensor histidine kinase/response regulator CckA
MLLIKDVSDRREAENRLVRLERFASIGRLSVSLIHELSNSLDGMRRYIQLLLDQMPEGDPERMYAERTQDGLVRIEKMVRGLLEFTKHSMSISRPIDVKQSISDTLRSFSHHISECNIEVKAEFGDDIPAILNTDVSQIFTNIIKNAIQAMPDGGTLSVSAKMLSPQLFEARFSDTGPGVPDEMRERIFDPFFTTKDMEYCVGLGLFVCQEIAESYNGSIDMESELGKGTTFIVRLPMYKGKILLMDDEKHIRDVAAEMLSSVGYKVITATDGTEAIEIYKEARDIGQPYDAVILDLVVPGGMGGKEAIQKLIEIDPEVKAIVSSGYPNDPLMADFTEHGFKGAITKPYKPEDIGELLHGLIIE